MTTQIKIIAAVVILVVLAVLIYVYQKWGKDKFTQFTVDMASARHPDPTWMKYNGRLRAPSGRDAYDNYYENKLLWTQGVDQRLEGNDAFETRDKIAHPRITVGSRYGLERGDRQDTFRRSEITWDSARADLLAERPAAPATRDQIETRAAEAENAALALAVNDEKPANPQERLASRY